MKNVMKSWPLFVALGLLLTFSSCKKNETTPVDNSVSASDINSVSNAITTNADEAALTADGSYARSVDGGNVWGVALCGDSEVVDTATKTITITYDGSTICHGIIRSGVVTVQLTTGTNWKDAGAVITVSTTGVKITDAVTQGYYTISGSHTITNETGGKLDDLASGSRDTITRRHQGSMEITFANGSTRTWTFDRTRSWTTFTSGGHKYLNAALYTEASNGVSETGYDRFNQNFTNKITVPIQSDNYTCSNESRWNPYAGERVHNINNRTVTVDFGTDDSGKSIGSNTYCSNNTAYGYYITYVNSNDNVTRHKFVSYWQH